LPVLPFVPKTVAGTISPLVSVESELSTPGRLGFSADSRRVILNQDATLVVVDAETGEASNRLDTSLHGTSSVVGPTAAQFVTSRTRLFDGDTVWDLTTGDEVMRFDVPSFAPPAVYALSPDGRTAAIVTGHLAGPVVMVYDVETGGQRYQLVTDKAQDLHGLAFNPDGTKLLTITGEGLTSQVWDVATGDLLFRIPAIEPTAFTADGRNVVAGNWGWNVYDAVTGGVVATHASDIDPMGVTGSFEMMSESGTRMVIGLQRTDQTRWTVAVYDTLTGVALVEIELGTLAFNPTPAINADGSRLVVTDVNGITTVWDLTTGRSLGTLTGWGSTGLVAAAFSSDGSKIAAVSMGGSLNIWPAP
jgi:WD40 repeat protein